MKKANWFEREWFQQWYKNTSKQQIKINHICVYINIHKNVYVYNCLIPLSPGHHSMLWTFNWRGPPQSAPEGVGNLKYEHIHIYFISQTYLTYLRFPFREYRISDKGVQDPTTRNPGLGRCLFNRLGLVRRRFRIRVLGLELGFYTSGHPFASLLVCFYM